MEVEEVVSSFRSDVKGEIFHLYCENKFLPLSISVPSLTCAPSGHYQHDFPYELVETCHFVLTLTLNGICRCKRAKKGAQYCFDAGHHLNPGDPRPNKVKRVAPAGPGTSSCDTCSYPFFEELIANNCFFHAVLRDVGGTPGSATKRPKVEGKTDSKGGDGCDEEPGSPTSQSGEREGGEEGEEVKESFEAGFDGRRPRRWERRLVPVTLIGGGELLVRRWVTDTARQVRRPPAPPRYPTAAPSAPPAPPRSPPALRRAVASR